MSDKKTAEERIAELDQKMKQLRLKKQRIVARESQKERKARTKRLIEVGAIFEKYFDISSKEDAEIIAQKISGEVKRMKGKWLSDAAMKEKGQYRQVRQPDIIHEPTGKGEKTK